MKTLHRRRLERLLDLMIRIPTNDLDMAVWKCGTSACIIGHAASQAWFQKQGLTLTLAPHSNFWSDQPVFRPTVDGEVLVGDQVIPQLATFFGISRQQADEWFCARSIRAVTDEDHVKLVCDEIRALLAENV